MMAFYCSRCHLPFVLLIGLCHAQEPPAATLSSQVYDVRDIVRTESGFSPATALEASFVPSSEVLDSSRPALDIADLVTLVQEGAAPEYWGQEGVEIRAEDGGLLTVTCSAGMQARVRRLLGQLRGLLFEPVLIEVHELPGSVLGAGRSVLTAEQTDAMLSQAGEHRVLFGRANPRKPLLLESKRTRNRIVGLGAKVANDAAAPDLDVAIDAYGASWTVHALRTVGDEMLVTVTGSDRALEPGPVTRKVPAGDDRVAALELSATRIATCHASAYLGQGQALLVGSDAPQGGALCVRVRPAGGRVDGQVGDVTAYAIACLVRGAVRGHNLRIPFEDGWLFPDDDEEPLPAVFDEGRLMEWLTSRVAPDSWDGAPNTMNFVDGSLFVRAGAATQQALAGQLRALQAIDARQFTLEVRFGEVAGDAVAAVTTDAAGGLAEALPQRCLSTVSASREARLSATLHTPYVRSYEAVIAQSSAVTVPWIDSFAQGFLLRARVAPMDPGTVMLDLNLTMLAHDADRPVFDLQHPRLGTVDKVDVRENKVRGASAVELDKWTVLHLSPVEGGTAHVAVVARVQSL